MNFLRPGPPDYGSDERGLPGRATVVHRFLRVRMAIAAPPCAHDVVVRRNRAWGGCAPLADVWQYARRWSAFEGWFPDAIAGAIAASWGCGWRGCAGRFGEPAGCAGWQMVLVSRAARRRRFKGGHIERPPGPRVARRARRGRMHSGSGLVLDGETPAVQGAIIT